MQHHGNEPSSMSSSDARNHFRDVMHKVAYGHQRIVVTHSGKEMAAVVSVDDLRFLQAIEEQELRADIQAALEAKSRVSTEGADDWDNVKDEITGI